MEISVRRTTFIDFPFLAESLGLDSLVLASEAFQWTGSFKFRAADSVVRSVPHSTIIAASSGNFGQALSLACSSRGKQAIIVMPSTSAAVKISGVARYGGQPELIDTTQISRAERVRQLIEQYPDAYAASAYDDPLVIQGNASLGREIGVCQPSFDIVAVPIGGGGLSAGIITGLQEAGSDAKVLGAEPAMADDAFRSLQQGKIAANQSEPQTLADGARTLSLGRHNWPILRDGLAGIITVSEELIARAVRVLYDANVKSEPTGALALAAILHQPASLQGARVCCIVSGGNADPALYSRLILESRNHTA